MGSYIRIYGIVKTIRVSEEYHAWLSAHKRAVRNRLLGYPGIDVDEEVGRVAGTLLAEADDRANGDAGVGANDGYVAAMARTLDDAVLTDDVGGFEALDVPVETY